jgi:hypothetical protein
MTEILTNSIEGACEIRLYMSVVLSPPKKTQNL